MTNFQLTLTGIFIAALIIAVLVFAGIFPGFRSPNGGVGGQVILWGTLPQSLVDNALADFNESHKKEFTLIYVEQSARTFESDFVDALASGKGPDLVLMPSSLAIKQANKLLPIPYETYDKNKFESSFIGEAKLYNTPSGSLALPVTVDPMVMYVNKDLLTSGRIAQVPKNWTEVKDAIKNLTLADAQSNVTQSAIAMGLFSNINHAKDILSLLIMQDGNPIVDDSGKVILKDTMGLTKSPAEEATAFFARFADPANVLYSWNSSLPEAQDAFIRSKLVLYLGFASELPLISKKNPQLNFGVSLVPQLSGIGRNVLTLGNLNGISVVKSSKNVATALSVAQLLTDTQVNQILAGLYGLPSARTDLLGNVPNDSTLTTFNQSAIISRNWSDPDPAASTQIFREMFEGITVKSRGSGEVITDAQNELQSLLNK